jgi:type IV pilus assembly protein PilX
MNKQSFHSTKHQQGAALAVGLILLLIITLMGYAGMKGTMLQEKMAAGLHNRSLAMAGANSAVRAGESFLYNLIDSTNSVQASGTPSGSFYNLYSQLSDTNDPTSPINPTVELFKQRNWTSSAGTVHGNNFTASSYNGGLSQQPEYIIEELQYEVDNGGSDDFDKRGGPDNSDTQKVFLITGKSPSGDGRTIVAVQSMFTAVISSSSSN